MKILLTGAGGFLGKYVHASLVSRNHKVVSIVRKKSGVSCEIEFDFKRGAYDLLEPLIEECDCVIHLAAVVDFEKKFNSEIYDTNYISVLNIAKIAALYKKYVIFSSSASIAQAVDGVICNKSVDSPESHYTLSKYIAEKAIENMLTAYCIIRIGGIYGYSGPEHLYLNKAIRQALIEKIPPTVHGEGRSKRNYIYVKDAADWVRFLAEHKPTGKFLLAGDDITNIRTVLSYVSDLYLDGTKGLIEVAGNNPSDFIINGEPPPIVLHSYKDALIDILKDFKKVKNK